MTCSGNFYTSDLFTAQSCESQSDLQNLHLIDWNLLTYSLDFEPSDIKHTMQGDKNPMA